ncbi:hypothetical protein MPTK1_2g13000 [Marchantia polymorpha subsp. ruderalis]|uniref:Uncharacterized protein n=1 Tax=Marchantia polymorpha TaxID=3197 RepID=A0A2R6XAR4_MARPO|nr:hypothetical protein MARPO_0026s0072 [Marchantia polymorpha]BBN02123.1 hypothetical protein Mp_2g13000 [Marchantia polymorpha subsp. ruderalis]|eukprot:PTQ43197.1 hypothetical protein MARPO_0026s0072 [Marchantia polymorpha]
MCAQARIQQSRIMNEQYKKGRFKPGLRPVQKVKSLRLTHGQYRGQDVESCAMLSAVEKTRRFCAAQVRRILGDSVVQKDNKSATEKGCGIGISKESGRATGRDPSDLGLKKGKAVVREHSKALGNRWGRASKGTGTVARAHNDARK